MKLRSPLLLPLIALLLASLACQTLLGPRDSGRPTTDDPLTNDPPIAPTEKQDDPTLEPNNDETIFPDQPTVDTSSLPPEIQVNTSEKFYEVDGDSADELREQLNLNGYVTDTGERFDANTNWEYRWHYYYNDSGTECAIESASLTVNIEYYLPRWNHNANDPNELVTRWENYMTALLAHEYHHGKIAIDAAEDVYQAILNTPAQSTCSELEEAANAAANLVVEEVRDAQEAYDAGNNHGMDDGAVFP